MTNYITRTLSGDTTSKSSASFCVQDAETKSNFHKQSYTQEQQDFSTQFYTKVCEAYMRSTVYKTYRKNFIAIKVASATKADLTSKAVYALDAFADSHNIVIVTSGKHVIYRIPA